MDVLKMARPVRHLVWCAWVAGCLFLPLCWQALYPAPAEADTISRQEIQAAFIIKFIKYIQWPDHASGGKESQWFTIAVLGDNNYTGLFEPFQNRLFKDRKLRIIRSADGREIREAGEGEIQILVAGQGQEKTLSELLSLFSGQPVLTFGDFPGFIQKGGMVNFYRKPSNRIGFELNMDARERSGIKISSHLLRMAKRVFEK